jgi:thiol:disulfide interchange protein
LEAVARRVGRAINCKLIFWHTQKSLSYSDAKWQKVDMTNMTAQSRQNSNLAQNWHAIWRAIWCELRLISAVFALLAIAPFAHAQMPGQPHKVSAQLVAETDNPAKGKMVTLAIAMTPQSGWHDYWTNPGDAGTPLKLVWDLPEGMSAGPIRAPVPETLIVSGFMNHVYPKPHAFLVDLAIPASANVGDKLPVALHAEWSACSDKVCVPESANLEISLAIGNGANSKARQEQFDGWRAALPVPLGSGAIYTMTGTHISIAIPFPAGAQIGEAHFFPATEDIFAYAAPQSVKRNGDWLLLKTKLKKPADGQIEGILRLGNGAGLLIKAQSGSLPQGAVGKDTSEPVNANIVTLFDFALLGGLLLNLMPCVFPILGLKALSLAKMGGDERAAKRDAIAYSTGVVAFCLILGGVLLFLRAAGSEIGWAFQLQEPRVVFLLLLVMTAITANLAGLFELGSIAIGGTYTGKQGLTGSFWTGALAAIVATPCTGPFMAAAMGAALILPTAQALLLFAGLGIGLASPYLAIAFIPSLRNKLPKPGIWLVRFRNLMAIPMALTTLALAWLLWRLSGVPALAIGACTALAVLAILFWAGRQQRQGVGVGKLLAIGVLVISGAGLAIFSPFADGAVRNIAASHLGAEPYSDALLKRYRSEGRPVFVYFTADWCVTCKVNEANAIGTEATASHFKKAGVKVLVGDYTRPDPAITRTLSQYGSAGVPLYLYFPKGGGDVQILPQILTPALMERL